MVVGYKEDPVYYDLCIKSLKDTDQHLINLNKIIMVIDGNTPDDYYMRDKFMEIFNTNSVCIELFSTPDKDDSILLEHMNLIHAHKYICIMQPHNGKRVAMYTGFSISKLEKTIYNHNIKCIFCTDSDTIVKFENVENMFKLFENKDIGAVASDLAIYNKYDSLISFFSSIRYWYAFNLERAYQSYNNCVLCVSGPSGMYRLDSLDQIMSQWINQSFLGKICTYGDDRHLTNKILSLKKQIVYMPSNKPMTTETPTSIYRFFQQQTRWSKSSFREVFWTLPIIDRHSVMMTIDLIYTFIYPFIVIGYLFYILYAGTLLDFGIYTTIVLILGIIKSLYGCIVAKNSEHLFYFLYIIPYTCIVFPSKLWALININDTSWGTSSRKILSKQIHYDSFIIIIYNLSLLCGISYCIYRNLYQFSHTQPLSLYLIITTSSIYTISFIIMLIYVKLMKSYEKKNF
jgi:hyaluronan synthase